jgi:hypothetical protein
MVGGILQGNFDIALLRAWFVAQANFILSWEPFYIDAMVRAQVGGAISFMKAEVSADIHFWGPEFGGRVAFEILWINISLEFGARHPGLAPIPLKWEEFKKRFLQGTVCSLTAGKGLLKTINIGTKEAAEERWIINPKEICVSTQSTIPVTGVKGVELKGELPSELSKFYIAPMGGDKIKELTTELSITINRKGKRGNVNNEFVAVPIYQNFPSALWGKEFITPKSNLNEGSNLVKKLITGYELEPAPKEPTVDGQVLPIPQKNIGFNPTTNQSPCQWVAMGNYQFDTTLPTEQSRRDKLKDTIGTTYEKRKKLAELMGLNKETIEMLDEKPLEIDDYIAVPGVGYRSIA